MWKLLLSTKIPVTVLSYFLHTIFFILIVNIVQEHIVLFIFFWNIFYVSSLTCNRRGIKVSISRIWADSSIKMLSYWEKKSKEMSINTVTQMNVFILPTKRKHLLLVQFLLGGTVTAGFHPTGKKSVLPKGWSPTTSMADLSEPVRAYL